MCDLFVTSVTGHLVVVAAAAAAVVVVACACKFVKSQYKKGC